jgi:hypothetical protein
MLLVLFAGLLVHLLLCPPSAVAAPPPGPAVVAYADGSGGVRAHHRDDQPAVPPGIKHAKRIAVSEAGFLACLLHLRGRIRTVRQGCPPLPTAWTGPPFGAILLTRLCISRT